MPRRGQSQPRREAARATPGPALILRARRLFDAKGPLPEAWWTVAGDAAKAFERRLRVLQLLPRSPKKVAAREIREKLRDVYDIETTPRTVERDLVELSGFLPIVNDADKGTKPYGWSWLGDAHALDIPHMTPAAALAFHFAERFLEDHLPPAAVAPLTPHFARARAVLDELHREGLATWPQKIRVQGRGQPLLPPRTEPQVLETVYTALLRDRRVRVQYRRRGAAAKKPMLLNPLGLVLRDRIAYLACTIDDHADVRALRLHRMSDATLSEEPRAVPSDFDLDAFVASGGAGFREGSALIQLELRVSENVLTTLEETPLDEHQEVSALPDGRYFVRAQVANTFDLRGFLRSYGDELEVIAPPAVRAELARTARSLISLYAGDPKPPASTRGNRAAFDGARSKTGSGER